MNFKYISFLFSFFILFSIKSQELIEFSMGSGYQYDIYFSLENGLTGYPERDNWELAFSTSVDDNNIRINSGSGVTLFEVSSDVSDWDEVTSIPSDAVQLRNSNIVWGEGAFVVNASGELNYGWGNYNPDTQIIEGSKIYIINYGGQSKKIRINSLDNGVFNFTFSNLDGSSELTTSVNTLDYLNKKFIYYSLTNLEIVNREPDSNDWDIVFTKYETDLNAENSQGELFYIVTGALSNSNLVYQYDGFLDVNPENSSIVNNAVYTISSIGWDWKEFGGGGYTIVPNRAYFILNQNENKIYKIFFESFSGGSSGNCSFFIEQTPYDSTSFPEITNNIINIYPNPSQGIFYVNSNEHQLECTILDTNGKIILNQILLNNEPIDLRNMPQGLYFINLASENAIINKKISIYR